MKKHTTIIILSIGLVIIQLLDIFLHAATNQLEVLRVSSNIVIFLWLAGFVFSWLKSGFLPISIGAVSLYLLLNIIFLFQAGVTNPNQGGELRVSLFLLVLLTGIGSAVLIYQQNQQAGE